MTRGYLRIDLADNCNIRCIMCQAYNSLPLARISFFDFERFQKHTRDQLKEWSTIQLGNIAEATIHPRFADFLRYVRSETGATIHIVTNGKLLNRYAALINEVGNCLVQVSMDSVHKETHEYIRVGSNYDRLVKSLSLLDITRTRVLLSFTLMNSNIGEYDDMVAFCRDRGFQMSAFPMILRDEDGVVPWGLLRESLWFNISALRAWLQRHYGADYERIVCGAASGVTHAITPFDCQAHHRDLSIYGDGRTVLCGKATLGSLIQLSLETMWQSETAQTFREQVDAARGPCMTCDYRQRCLSPSMSLLENHFSERIARTISPAVCEQIGFDRTIGDEEAIDLFVRDLRKNVAVFDIARSGNGMVARRVYSSQHRGEEVSAGSPHELQALMAAEIDAPLTPRLVEQCFHGYNIVGYGGRYWAIPLSLGVVNLCDESDRARPGIIRTHSLSATKRAAASTSRLAEAARRD